MIVDVKIPLLPESVPDATLLDWTKQVGNVVEKDEVLVELETDKVVLEVSAPVSGLLTEIAKVAGEIGVSNEVIARIDSSVAATPPGASAAAEAPAGTPAPASAPSGNAESLSPAVRRVVDEHKLDANAITTSGPGGRLTKGDVLAHIDATAATPNAKAVPAASSAPKPAGAAPAAPSAVSPAEAASPQARGERRVPMTRLRQRIAERLVQAQHTAAILTTFNEVNMQPAMELRKRLRDDFEKNHGVRLGFMSFFAKAAVQALQKFPAVNAYIEDNEIVYHDYCDIGVAVGSPRGLLVPIVRNVEHMNFAEIEGAIADYGQRAQAGSIGIEELNGGTFTISNGGVFGSMLSTPILNPPQSAILGMHATQVRPVVENGEIVARPMMYLALSYDHRIVDGREAVQFLVTIKDCIEDPGRMLLGV